MRQLYDCNFICIFASNTGQTRGPFGLLVNSECPELIKTSSGKQNRKSELSDLRFHFDNRSTFYLFSLLARSFPLSSLPPLYSDLRLDQWRMYACVRHKYSPCRLIAPFFPSQFAIPSTSSFSTLPDAGASTPNARPSPVSHARSFLKDRLYYDWRLRIMNPGRGAGSFPMPSMARPSMDVSGDRRRIQYRNIIIRDCCRMPSLSVLSTIWTQNTYGCTSARLLIRILSKGLERYRLPSSISYSQVH